MENRTVIEGKTIAIISYLTFIGLIIAFVMNNDKKNPFATFHIRQSLGLVLFLVLINILSYIVTIPMLTYILGLGVFVLWILGIIAAVQGEMKPVPLLGEQFQEWFKGI